ncbi:MAG: ribbon-helix-helix domain-containing protein [Xanthobacteraceae bacterium]
MLFHGRPKTKVASSQTIDRRCWTQTSISLEDAFWDALQEIATERRVTTATIVSSIDSDRQHNNLSSAICLFVLAHYRALAERRSRPPG